MRLTLTFCLLGVFFGCSAINSPAQALGGITKGKKLVQLNLPSLEMDINPPYGHNPLSNVFSVHSCSDSEAGYCWRVQGKGEKGERTRGKFNKNKMRVQSSSSGNELMWILL